MVYEGTIQDGVVVFSAGVPLPNGTAVRVEPVEDTSQEDVRSPKDDILFRMGEFAIETGIPDLAVNIDHYLYGHPKATDEKK